MLDRIGGLFDKTGRFFKAHPVVAAGVVAMGVLSVGILGAAAYTGAGLGAATYLFCAAAGLATFSALEGIQMRHLEKRRMSSALDMVVDDQENGSHMTPVAQFILSHGREGPDQARERIEDSRHGDEPGVDLTTVKVGPDTVEDLIAIGREPAGEAQAATGAPDEPGQEPRQTESASFRPT